jgi:hypothetical protein
MNPWRLGTALVLAMAAAGCTATNPFVTAPRGLAIGEQNPGTRVAICFNSFKTLPEKVQQLAQAQCVGDTVAERIETDYRLDDCPLLTPGRATFVCKSAK